MVRQALPDLARSIHGEMLSDVTGDLNKLRQRGLHDSAVNISLGHSPASTTMAMLDLVRNNRTMLDNVAGAYGLDVTKIISDDPTVNGAERARLHQVLVDATEAGAIAPQLKPVQARYQQAVHRLEAQHNSVVVSAGNEGEVLRDLTTLAGGRAPRTAPDFTTNVLSTPETTNVGATRWFRSGNKLQERYAGYNSPDTRTDLYASGSLATGADGQKMTIKGTSFAAPRDAAVMAAIHGRNSGMSSRQAENLLRNSLTHQLGDGRVLDDAAAREYLR